MSSLMPSRNFWANVAKRAAQECWPWRRSLRHGYGATHLRDAENKRNVSATAHRVAWLVTNGPIPDGLCVCHRCDNPACCNPAHLFLGTYADNNLDRKAKGRNGTSERTGFSTNPPRGESNRHAVLTETQVAKLRADYKAGTLNQRQYARDHGLSWTTVQRIVRGQTWRHLKPIIREES